jgi:hypothetical protein
MILVAFAAYLVVLAAVLATFVSPAVLEPVRTPPTPSPEGRTMTALDRMPDDWWESYVEECSAHHPGPACAVFRHVIDEENEIERLVDREHRVLDGVAELRFLRGGR